MNNHTSSLEFSHFPVMMNEVIKISSPATGGKFVDCTFGGGSYSKEILKFSKTYIHAFDRDRKVLPLAKEIKIKFPKRFKFYQKKFSQLDSITDKYVDTVIFDLGLSSIQLDDLNRGFSFKSNKKLNMRMGINEISALDVVNNLGEKEFSLPKIDSSSDQTLGDLPSRIFVGMLDVGTVEKDASNKGWNNSIERNADPAKIHAQSMMRYNQIFTQVVEIQIPLNTNLNAGSVIRCEFPQLASTKRKTADPETSGLYMIKELAHYFDGKGSYSKLKLVRDTYGRK